MTTLELLSSRRVNSLLNPVQASEADVVVQELHELWLENKDDSGGGDTTMITLTWAISLLLNNLHILKKAQMELDAQIGKQRHVKEADIASLTYLQAIVKETLRLHPQPPTLSAAPVHQGLHCRRVPRAQGHEVDLEHLENPNRP
ncbi:hypothetical protein NL676_025050 [Syzygium grande]|nr:hypothetical protein NL676_025050 [Syzygium grande]